MAEIEETKKGFILECDCGIIHKVAKNPEGDLIITSQAGKIQSKKTEIVEPEKITIEKIIEENEEDEIEEEDSADWFGYRRKPRKG